MIFPSKMDFFNLVLMKDNLSEGLDVLSEAGVHLESTSELIPTSQEFQEIDNKKIIKENINPLISKIKELKKELDLELKLKLKRKIKFSLDFYEKIQREFQVVWDKYEKLSDKIDYFEKESARLKQISQVLELLQENEIGLDLIQNSKYTSAIVGKLPYEQLQSLKYSIEKIPHEIIYNVLGNNSYAVFICVTIKENRDELEKKIEGFDIEEISIPHADTVSKLFQKSEMEMWSYEDEKADLKKEIAGLKKHNEQRIADWYFELITQRKMFRAMQDFVKSRNVYVVSGWIPSAKVDSLGGKLSSVLGKEIIFETTKSDFLENNFVFEPPTKLHNPSIFKSFENITKIYGIPSYKGIDPTPFLTITFLIMFGMMFGDVGHGFVLALLGIGLIIWNINQSVKNSGYIILSCGISSTIFGFLYGSFFGNENLLPTLWFKPLDSPSHLLMIGVYVGIFMISLGIILNIIKFIYQKKYRKAFFDQWGIISALFFWIVLGVVYLFTKNPNLSLNFYILAIIIISPLVFLAFGKRIIDYLSGKKESDKEEFVTVIFKPVEVSLNLLTNTISFIRVGAFALNHAALLGAVFLIADLMVKSDSVLNLSVVIPGQIFIIILEGLIVFIQCLRLQYYEFFSKFFGKQGKAYEPLKFQ